MKKLVKVLALVVVAAIACLALASCGGLSGKYESGGLLGAGKTELTFKGNKVTIEKLGLEAEATYKIDDDKIVIELDNAGDDAASIEDALNWFNGDHNFEKEDDYIKIDGIKFKKAD